MAVYVCKVCGYKYDEDKETIAFRDLSDEYKCPVCAVGKDMFAEE